MAAKQAKRDWIVVLAPNYVSSERYTVTVKAVRHEGAARKGKVIARKELGWARAAVMLTKEKPQ